MTPFKALIASAGIAFLFQAAACSEKPKAKHVAKVPEKPLIEVVYDAVRFQANGGASFQPPHGIEIETIKGKQKNAATVEVSGSQRKGRSVARITFTIPESWLSSEKERLGSLEPEMKGLTACAQKLMEKEASGGTATSEKDSCSMKEVTLNGLPGITIQDKKAGHMKMTILATQ